MQWNDLPVEDASWPLGATDHVPIAIPSILPRGQGLVCPEGNVMLGSNCKCLYHYGQRVTWELELLCACLFRDCW